MYAGDSFFTLGPWERAGLVAVSAGMAAVAFALAAVLWRRAGPRRWLRLLGALAAFWAFVWLAPQGHYTYYRAIIPGLPAQWVIGGPPGPERIALLLAFRARPTLSDHGKGVLGWVLLAGALPTLRRGRPRAGRDPSDRDAHG